MRAHDHHIVVLLHDDSLRSYACFEYARSCSINKNIPPTHTHTGTLSHVHKHDCECAWQWYEHVCMCVCVSVHDGNLCRAGNASARARPETILFAAHDRARQSSGMSGSERTTG